MTAKVPLATLAAVAKREGYTGDPLDAAKIKSHLLNHPDGAVEEIDYDGETFQIKDLEFAPAKPARKVKAEKVEAETKTVLPDDFDEKVKAVAKDMLVKAGFKFENNKVVPIDPERQTVKVKSGEERWYENRVKDGTAIFDNHADAKAYAEMVRIKALRAVGRMADADDLARKHNEWMSQKGYTLVQESTGAALAPEGYDANLIRLVKEYGVARKIARTVPMMTGDYSRPKVTSTSGLTVYYPQDGTAGTESSETWGRVRLRAKQGIVIVKMSRAVLDDSSISLIEDQTREAARAIAKVEDSSLFNGTGQTVSGNGYIPGVQGFTNLVTDTSTNSRLLKSGATTAGAVTLAELTAFMGLLPSFARNERTAFHCTPEMMNIVLTRLGQGQGGVTFREFMDLGDVPFVMGRPVILNNVLPNTNTTGANRILMMFGDISLAADFGDRKGVEVDISDQRYWDEVNLGLRAVVRHDINVHDVGATTTQSPVVFLSQT